MDQIFHILNEYPYLWIFYPIILVLPVVFLVAMCIKPGQQTEQNRQTRGNDRVISSGRSRKNQNEDQSDGDKKRDNVRYLVRRGEVQEDCDEIQLEEETHQWSFPPQLEEFNLMDLDIDPGMIEDIFTDKRLVQVVVRLITGEGLGLTIVGGKGSANGDVPIYIKRILSDSVLQKDGKLKTGDELIAVNDLLLVNATKEYASHALSNVVGTVRLLAIQDL